MIDFEIRVIVHVDPVLLADVGIDNESAVVILVCVMQRLSDIVLREGDVGYIGELADGNVSDVVGSLVGVLSGYTLHRCQFLRRFLYLGLVTFVIRQRLLLLLLLLLGRCAGVVHPGAIRPDVRGLRTIINSLLVAVTRTVNGPLLHYFVNSRSFNRLTRKPAYSRPASFRRSLLYHKL